MSDQDESYREQSYEEDSDDLPNENNEPDDVPFYLDIF